MPKGFLIVLEGTDGSGKGTQVELLLQRLRAVGSNARSISFPQYNHVSSSLVTALLKDKLSEEIGSAVDVAPKVASIFFAADRVTHAKKIQEWLGAGLIVVADRYTDSNAGHQGGKIANPEERAKFLEWLYRFEYDDLKIPRPDLVLVLDVTSEVASKLIDKKSEREHLEGEKRDAHEKDARHLSDAYNSYLWLVENYPESHRLIPCMADGELLSKEEILELIWEEVRDFIKIIEVPLR